MFYYCYRVVSSFHKVNKTFEKHLNEEFSSAFNPKTKGGFSITGSFRFQKGFHDYVKCECANVFIYSLLSLGSADSTIYIQHPWYWHFLSYGFIWIMSFQWSGRNWLSLDHELPVIWRELVITQSWASSDLAGTGYHLIMSFQWSGENWLSLNHELPVIWQELVITVLPCTVRSYRALYAAVVTKFPWFNSSEACHHLCAVIPGTTHLKHK